MSDGAPTPHHPTAKKLPFKATALRKAALLKVGTITDKKRSENDGLDLFRRLTRQLIVRPSDAVPPKASKMREPIAPAPTKQSGNLEPIQSSFIAGDKDDEFVKYIRKVEEQRAQEQALLGPDRAAAPETIDILVTSIVHNTKPCCFKFLFDKQLQLARNTWLALQKVRRVLLDVEREDDIVLTWRKKREYAFSTLLDLGIRPEGNGPAVLDGHSTDGLVNSRTRVHMEAWTRELFQEMEREEQLKRKRETGELPDQGDTAPVGEEHPAPEVKIRVILKAYDRADVKLTVRPVTTVETLITGFRTQQSIGSDRNVEVWFDGDRLDKHVTMNEAEIDDMDTLEVHVK